MRFVHLVGSVPLSDADEVFRVTGEMLGDHLKRYPDGETGGRKEWVQWQMHSLVDHPQFETTASRPVVINHSVAQTERVFYKLKDGVAPEDVLRPTRAWSHPARRAVPRLHPEPTGIPVRTDCRLRAIPRRAGIHAASAPGDR
jgi:hypothetical protein